MSFLPRSLEDMDLTFPPDIAHVSASSLNMALRCEEQWRQVYVLKQRKPPGLNQIAGRADHRAIEVSMAQKIETHEDLPVKDVMDAFVEKLEQDVDEAGGLGELEGKPKVDEFDTLRYEGQRVVAGYHSTVSPTIQPVAVEEEFVLDLASLPVPILGYIDLRSETEIIDRKRSKRAQYKASADWQFQGHIYQLARPLPYRWHISVTTKTPQFLTELEMPLFPPSITERKMRDACLKIGWLYQRYGPDEPWPTTGTSHGWACNYCGFRDGCPGWPRTPYVV